MVQPASLSPTTTTTRTQTLSHHLAHFGKIVLPSSPLFFLMRRPHCLAEVLSRTVFVLVCHHLGGRFVYFGPRGLVGFALSTLPETHYSREAAKKAIVLFFL